MSLVVPAGYISTPDAFTEMLTFDSEWRRLSESWEKDGRPIGGATFADIDERQEALAAELHKAVIACEIPLFAYTLRDTGERCLEELTGGYRNDPAAETELRTGTIHKLRLTGKERAAMGGAALCFRRAVWGVWLAHHSGDQTTLTAPEGPALHAAIRKWFAGAYPNGRTKPWKTLRDECAAALKRPSLSEKTMRRVLKSRQKAD